MYKSQQQWGRGVAGGWRVVSGQRLHVVLGHEAGAAVERAAQPARLGRGRHVGDDLVGLEGQLALALAQAGVERAHARAAQRGRARLQHQRRRRTVRRARRVGRHRLGRRAAGRRRARRPQQRQRRVQRGARRRRRRRRQPRAHQLLQQLLVVRREARARARAAGPARQPLGHHTHDVGAHLQGDRRGGGPATNGLVFTSLHFKWVHEPLMKEHPARTDKERSVHAEILCGNFDRNYNKW